MKKHNYISSFLPFKNYHIVDVRGLSPEEIKLAVKNIGRDREKIQTTTALNHITKSLGFSGGFASYKENYQNQLVPFMEKNGLWHRKNMCEFRHPGARRELHALTRQQIAERFFYSKKNKPKKLFTGYNLNFEKYWDCGQDIFGLSPIHSCPEIDKYGLKYKFEFKDPYILKNIQVAQKNPDVLSSSNDDYFTGRSLTDVVIGGYLEDIECAFNLLGDLLVYPQIHDPIVNYFYEGVGAGFKCDREKTGYHALLKFFRSRIDSLEQGWVELIPFNKNLVFLKGDNGEYDFLFAGLKDNAFDHQIFKPHLYLEDTPKSFVEYNFLRWEYFHYKGFNSLINHQVEDSYYKKGGKAMHLLSNNFLRIKYHTDKGSYIPPKLKSSKKLTGFKEVSIPGKRLMISDLITIDQFNQYLKDDPDYHKYRTGDNLSIVNSDPSSSVPASVTWYDALAFIKNLEKKLDVPLSLLTYEDYLAVRGEKKPCINYQDPIDNGKLETYYNDIEVVLQTGEVVKYPTFIHDNDKLRFSKPLNYVYSDNGIKFVNSIDFAEWLYEGTCIRSGNLQGFHKNPFVLRQRPNPNLTGMYKGLKTGFRLCYELEQDQATVQKKEKIA